MIGSMASVMGFPIELVENLVKEVIDASTLEHIDPQESSTNIE